MHKSPIHAAAITLFTVVVSNAHAATLYDGPWQVTITTTRGTCSSGSSFGLQIRDGIVYGGGGFSVSGRVTVSGAVRVEVNAGDQHAGGNGRLSGAQGRGTWRGAGSQGVCTGYWTASRV